MMKVLISLELFVDPLRRTYAPFLHNTITKLAGVPRTYEKLESTDMAVSTVHLYISQATLLISMLVQMFLELTKRADFGGSAVTMSVYFIQLRLRQAKE
jgi:quinate dehydrogenase